MEIQTKNGRGELAVRAQRWEFFGAESSQEVLKIVDFSLNLGSKLELDFETKIYRISHQKRA